MLLESAAEIKEVSIASKIILLYSKIHIVNPKELNSIDSIFKF